MTTPKRNKLQKAEDVKKATSLRLKGRTLRQIGAEIGLHYSRVHRDLKEIEADLIQEARADMAELRAQTLAKLRHVQIEAQRGWALSIQDKIKVADNGQDSITTRETQKGDPAYLNAYLKSVTEEAQLLGLYAAQVEEDTSNDLIQALTAQVEAARQKYDPLPEGCIEWTLPQEIKTVEDFKKKTVIRLPDNGRRTRQTD